VSLLGDEKTTLVFAGYVDLRNSALDSEPLHCRYLSTFLQAGECDIVYHRLQHVYPFIFVMFFLERMVIMLPCYCNFIKNLLAKNYRNRTRFDNFIAKNDIGAVLPHHVLCSIMWL